MKHKMKLKRPTQPQCARCWSFQNYMSSLIFVTSLRIAPDGIRKGFDEEFGRHHRFQVLVHSHWRNRRARQRTDTRGRLHRKIRLGREGGSIVKRTDSKESSGKRQGNGTVPCRNGEFFHFSKSSKAVLSVQASSMMSQSGRS
jgi:hypothetical protein